MKKQNRHSLTEKLFIGGKSKSTQQALNSFRTYKKTMSVVDKVNMALGKKSVYNTTSNSTLNIKIVSNGISTTTAI